MGTPNKRPALKDCDDLDLENNLNALRVMKLPIPGKVKFAKNGKEAVIIDSEGNHLSIPKNEFEQAYFVFDAKNRLYAKKKTVSLALKMKSHFKAGEGVGTPGDWLIQHPTGEKAVIKAEVFKKTHVPATKLVGIEKSP
jgi:hypothetical protein